jgi:hypothetical protein
MFNIQPYSGSLLRLGVAFAFIYPALDAFFHPDAWIGFFPFFMRDYVSDALLLNAWGIFEIVIGIWILSDKKIFIPSLIATLSLIGIVVFNFSLIDILFRDIALALAAASLVLSAANERVS